MKETQKENSETLNKIHRIREEEDEFIVAELEKAGYKVSSLFDLVNSKQTDCGYISTLLELLESDKINDPIMKDGLIRAITEKKAKGIVEAKVLGYYNNLGNDGEKELIGCVLAPVNLEYFDFFLFTL